MGGLAVLALFIFGILFLRRRRKQQASHERTNFVPEVAVMEPAHPYKDDSPNRKHRSEHLTVNETVLTAAQLAKIPPLSTNFPRTVHTERRRRHRLQLMVSRRCHRHKQQMLRTNCRSEKSRESMWSCPEILIEDRRSSRMWLLGARQ